MTKNMFLCFSFFFLFCLRYDDPDLYTKKENGRKEKKKKGFRTWHR